jgi:hypothetical protein
VSITYIPTAVNPTSLNLRLVAYNTALVATGLSLVSPNLISILKTIKLYYNKSKRKVKAKSANNKDKDILARKKVN